MSKEQWVSVLLFTSGTGKSISGLINVSVKPGLAHSDPIDFRYKLIKNSHAAS